MTVKSNTLLTAWATFFEAHAHSINQIEKSLSVSAPLSLHEYDVLLTLDRAPEKKLRFSDLTTKSIFTKSGITRIMKRLVDRGFIDRHKCESDGRGVFAELNKKGAKALKDTWAIYSKEILKIFEPALTQAEGKQLEMLLGKILDQVNEQTLVSIGAKTSRK